MFEKAGFGSISEASQTPNSTVGQNIHLDGMRGDVWAHVDARCYPSDDAVASADDQSAGEAFFREGRCILVVGAKSKSTSGAALPDQSRELITAILNGS